MRCLNPESFFTNPDFNQKRLNQNVTLFTQKDLNKSQQQENHVPHLLENNGNKASKMLILDDTTADSDGNWFRSILRERERKINDCDFHDKCISTQKLKVT